MKRCPTCRRDYHDDSLAYCLDDGTVLVDGPSTEQPTAILHGSTVNEPTAILPETSIDSNAGSHLRAGARAYIAATAIFLGIILGIGGYYYYARDHATRIASIAILPFSNQNSDPNTEYLADGIPESISNALSQLSDLKVMSRNSVSHYKGSDVDPQSVARELNVQAVLFGRVTQHDTDLSISVELINARDNSKIWGQQYSRKLTDIFTMQEEIAKEISEKLQLKLYADRKLARRPTENIKAFQYYSQGREYYARRTRQDLLTTISYYEKAIAEDANYALAYAGLADAYGALGVRSYISPIEARRKEEDYARRAIELDENLAEAHASMGLPDVVFAPFDFAAGDRELRRAIELSPSLAAAHQYLGHSLAAQGRSDEALAEYIKARELDPLSSIIARNVATAYYFKGEYARALDLLKQANELGPPFTNPIEIEVYIKNGRLDETLAELNDARKGRPDDPLLIFDVGMIYAAQGKRVDAMQMIKQLEQMSGTSFTQAQFISRIYAALNDKEMTFQWLELGLGTGATGPIDPKDKEWEFIRDDPHFRDILNRMGLSLR